LEKSINFSSSIVNFANTSNRADGFLVRKVGANINVVAADKDIKNAKQFKAAEIILQQMQTAVSPTAPAPTTVK